MESNRHLLYYWAEFEKNLKDGNVGRLGTKNPCKKVFATFKDSVSSHSDSWIVAFRWEKPKKKVFPLAVLKACPNPLVQLEFNPDHVEVIYFDPRQSFRLNQPTDSTRLKKYHDFGERIVGLFSIKAQNANFNGANSVQLLSDEDVLTLLDYAEQFRGNELSVHVNRSSWLEKSSTSKGVANSAEEGSGTYQSRSYDIEPPDNLSSDDGDNADSIANLKDDLELESAQIDSDYANKPGADVDAVVKRRVGQGLFRNLLERIYGGSCCVSGLTNKKLLIASHIVPWSRALPEQKTDPQNGLLLSVIWDALFDKGFVSFANDGTLLCSERLDKDAKQCLGIATDVTLPEDMLTESRRANLSWHRRTHGFET